MSNSVDWLSIRQDYENGTSLRQLASRYNVSKTYIIEKRNKENWDRPTPTTTDRPLEMQGIQKRDVNAAMRVAMALKLRAQKLTYEEIAKQCGYGSAGSCYKAVQRELNRVVVANVEELRREEAHMYDIGHSEIWSLFMDRKNKGRLFAWDRILATSEARRRMFAIDVKTDGVDAGTTIIYEYDVEVGRV